MATILSDHTFTHTLFLDGDWGKSKLDQLFVSQ
ncbi:hypothetical protein HCH_04395 [Hahella chejuensis KCTC 2396]|uniref:Uncharacterized protein n=1 Tax=Hahella chejuensis (strain KCTC 2396) TaxID=349521 RepID=Q2SE24_HAHCH|nr:hypothetical protein HCH_04395 [Hahella chejuensis KCTC 2396]